MFLLGVEGVGGSQSSIRLPSPSLSQRFYLYSSPSPDGSYIPRTAMSLHRKDTHKIARPPSPTVDQVNVAGARRDLLGSASAATLKRYPAAYLCQCP